MKNISADWRKITTEDNRELFACSFEFKNLKQASSFVAKIGELMDGKYKKESVNVSLSNQEVLVFLNSSGKKPLVERHFKIAQDIDSLL